MLTLEIPEIVLVGLDDDKIFYLNLYLKEKYNFFLVKEDLISIDKLVKHDNICLFIVDCDKPWTRIEDFVKELKSHVHFQNIPILATCHKKHINDLNIQYRRMFEDLIAKPFNYEDLITRIEVWVKTYEFLTNSDIKARSYCIKDSKIRDTNEKLEIVTNDECSI